MKPFILLRINHEHCTKEQHRGCRFYVHGEYEREGNAYTDMRERMSRRLDPCDEYCVVRLHFFEQSNRIIEAEGVY